MSRLTRRPLRRAVSAALAVVLATFLVPLAAAPALACSCVGVTEEEALGMADVAFSGRALGTTEPAPGLFGTQSSDAPVTTTFAVDTVYLGAVHEVTRVTSALDGASCGFDFVADTRYLVFAAHGGDGIVRISSEELGVNLCNGTRVLDDAPPTVGTAGPPLSGSGGSSAPVFPLLGWLSLLGVAGLAAGTGVLWLRLVLSARAPRPS